MKSVRFSNFAARFRKVILEYAGGLDQSAIAERLGTTQATISRVMNGSMLPPDTVVDTMKDLWGVDMRDEVKGIRMSSKYGIKTEEPQVSVRSGVPYYDIDFIGGFDLIINDQTLAPAYLIDFKPYERATCWCNITGHSMEPEISHGDIIALRKINDWSYIPFGEVYAIVTRNDMRTVKRLAKGSSEDTFTLIPTNKSPEYAPQEIKKSDILCMYEVMGCMKKF